MPVEPDQELLAAQLRRGHPDQHLPRGEPAFPSLDRPDRGVEPVDHPDSVAQLGHRGQSGEPGQRLVRRANPHACAPGSSPAYSAVG
jgi:hypothetical protein